MSGILGELGRAAAALRVGDVPTEVLDAMRGLHLAQAGAHAGYADAVLGGRVSEVPSALWEDLGSADLEHLCAATAIGLEVGARAGLYRLFCAPEVTQEALAGRVAAAVARAWLHGAPADLSAFDAELDRENRFPLPGALTELGHVWVGRSLALATGPGSAWTNVAVEGLHEILHRHVRASEKRLRADQVERVTVRVNAWTAQADAALPPHERLAAQMGRLVASYARDGNNDPDGAAAVTERTEVTTDLRLTIKGANALAASLGGLIGGQVAALRVATRWLDGLHADALPELVRARPDRALLTLLRPAGTLAGADPQPWALPVEIKLFTTRGGWWPERRQRPEGSIAGHDLRHNAVTRWAGDDAARARRADALFDAPGSGSAAQWVRELRA